MKNKLKKPSPVEIDYPREGEQIVPAPYTIRVAAENASKVEVSLDGKEWRSCRESLGLYWFDWHPKSTGAQAILARAKLGGRYRRAQTRKVKVG